MKRGTKYDDNKSEIPLSVPSASWQRFQTVDEQSNSSSINCNSQSVSISRTSGFITHSEIGDSISNNSASLQRLDDNDYDDEKTSQVRESLKRELKMIQVAKADLKVKRKVKNVQSSHTITNGPPSEAGDNNELFEEISTMKQKLFEKNCRI